MLDPRTTRLLLPLVLPVVPLVLPVVPRTSLATGRVARANSTRVQVGLQVLPVPRARVTVIAVWRAGPAHSLFNWSRWPVSRETDGRLRVSQLGSVSTRLHDEGQWRCANAPFGRLRSAGRSDQTGP